MPIHLPFKKLSSWHQVTFAAALLERMLPNYQLFCESFDCGDATLLRNQLDLVWQKLAPKGLKVNIDAQITKLEDLIPDPAEFDSFGVYPAIDTCMAMISLWQAFADQTDETTTEVSQLSANSVAAYVELLLQEELAQLDAKQAQQAIDQHPLMQWEKAMQNELFDYLKLAKPSAETLKAVKELALAEGLSNLGIEIGD